MKPARLIIGFLFILFLSGCSLIPGLSKKPENITLNYWGLWESSSIVNQIITDFKNEHPNIDIVYTKKSHQQYRESLQSQIESGKGPDIFRFHNTWTPMLESILTPVPTDVVSAKEFKQNFYPTVFSDLRNTNKEFIGVPLEIDGLTLFWNEDIFRAAGILKPPSTWRELTQTAVNLTVRDTAGNINTAGIALGTASNVDHFSDILGLMILQNGGDPKSPIDKASVDSLEYYTNFAKGNNRVWDEAMPSSTVAFVGGSLAMYLAPSWRAIEIKNSNPLLKFQAAPVPQLEGGKVGWATYWSEGVSKKSPHIKEAWEFVKFLQKEESLIKLYSESAKSPGRFFGEPYPKVSMAAKLISDPLIGAIIADAPYMRSFPMASRTFDNGINDQIIKAYEDAVNSVLSGSSAKNALETTAKNINNILTRYSANP
ncbi:hypothetical protein A3A48_02805 [Candidatus Curtissbacteria bacterium RIFCSPLOWO2_01_FULL_37_9]|uniref:ABC transporter substrate-binding protein n=1 Tax=Candidatus Curtissbacteria bacterium RIFCSPLOWO2_01_FULL_37_9 TaxID=1797724 RepID=A0A1F5GQN5_9BACT|nr:MAG: hypothetical protein A3A48_02805 [Candidatus Curtissbacteria bacterium RIFCSPLOWO2_01_FULL_37_9]